MKSGFFQPRPVDLFSFNPDQTSISEGLRSPSETALRRVMRAAERPIIAAKESHAPGIAWL
jgi:hypothetical protein